MSMRYGITLLLFTSLLASISSSASAATAYRGKPHAAYRSNKRKVPPKIQQHFSFIPPKQPSPLIQKLQAPLQVRVVQQQVSPAPITSAIPASPIIEKLSVPVQSENFAIKKIGFWGRMKNRRALKASHPSPERITPQHSWIEHVSASDMAPLSELIASWLQTQIAKPQATLVLADPPQTQAKSTFIPNLAYALEQRGFVIAGKDANGPDAYWVRYRIRSFEQGLLVQIKINGQEISRLYTRSQTGALVAASPMTQFKAGGHP